MTARRTAVLAAACSFAVYLIPIAGPHAIVLVAEAIWQQWRDLHDVAWALSNTGVALLLQAAAFALFFWFLRARSILSLAVLVAGAAGSIVLVQAVYMLWLPAHFLIEVDAAPEIGAWTEACHVDHASVMTWRTPRRVPESGWDEAWLSDSENAQWLLRMPDCRRTAAPLPTAHFDANGHVDFSIGIVQIIAGGRALVQRHETRTGALSWYLLTPGVEGAAALRPLAEPSGAKSPAPFLSDDGLETAWIVPIAGSGPPVLDTLRLVPTDASRPEATIDLAPLGPGTYEVVDVSRPSGELLLWDGVPARLIALDFDGHRRPAPSIPTGVEPQSSTIVLTPHGVLAWDAYKDNDDYWLAWAMDTGTGRRRIPKGSSIIAAAADPTGRLVAVSTSTTLNIGDVRDAVFVLNTSDGREVFRRFVPRYSRSNVVFLRSGYFVYSDGTTARVVQIPPL